MKSIGIVRNLDKLHRLVIPRELCHVYGLDSGTPMEIFTEGNCIILRKYEKSCAACGARLGDDAVHIGGLSLCRACAEKAARKIVERKNKRCSSNSI